MKHVIVWGAAGGIGRAVCEELAGDGDTVVAVARDASDLASI
ncbi:MAG: SDR family NAD(P)-dependent oxidoreductase, partial [Chloroflexi bacterium]|nr:SDR family NAD(P)-dependent oxidoreductase [Chloroflexota bacterium]